ncbi:DUF4870 domain-containing protein [Alicyclobacillus curvatus]|nr:DUF4870 domain-containing protein [Alicyclobacillus curvatus]
MACHLAAFAGWVIPLGWILGPLTVWLIKRNQFWLVDEQGKEALNFQISLMIYGIIAGILCLILIGFLLLIALAVLQIVLVIIAAIKVSNGEHYRYPLTIRLIR